MNLPLSQSDVSDRGTGDFKDPATGTLSPPPPPALIFSLDFISLVISLSLDGSFSFSFSAVDFDSALVTIILDFSSLEDFSSLLAFSFSLSDLGVFSLVSLAFSSLFARSSFGFSFPSFPSVLASGVAAGVFSFFSLSFSFPHFSLSSFSLITLLHRIKGY